MSANSLCCCLHTDDVFKKMIINSGHDLGKIKKPPPLIRGPLEYVPPSSPEFEKSATITNSRIHGTPEMYLKMFLHLK